MSFISCANAGQEAGPYLSFASEYAGKVAAWHATECGASCCKNAAAHVDLQKLLSVPVKPVKTAVKTLPE